MTLPRLIVSILLTITCFLGISAQETEVLYYAVPTTNLNVRTGPGKGYRLLTSLTCADTVAVVQQNQYSAWVEIQAQYIQGWVHSDYLRSILDAPQWIRVQQQPVQEEITTPSSSSFFDFGFWDVVGFCFKVLMWIVVIGIALKILAWMLDGIVVVLGLGLVLGKLFYDIVSIPFFISNTLQRYLAKPWLIFYKSPRHNDDTNEDMRTMYEFLKIPMYILLFPIRLGNAVFFNLFTHCTFEVMNYLLEMIFPSLDEEGADDLWTWILYLPVRIVKYSYHAVLTLIESLIWTVLDCFLPALTLYHGTDPTAAQEILRSPSRGGGGCWFTGVWKVGGGNYAGNGIYFAPARSTSEHYAAGSMIVCRVTLGRTLDLGLAPRRIFNQCGFANATGATQWGLNNDYVTGEWWRSDRSWWEYCMYDWQNRYNSSWRIRPLYVVDMKTGYMQRIPGGMTHWLFREMVVNDMLETTTKFWR